MSLLITLKVILLPLSLHLIHSIFLVLPIFLQFVILQVCLARCQFLLPHHFKFRVAGIVLINHRVTQLKCQLLCLLWLRQLNLFRHLSLTFHPVTFQKRIHSTSNPSPQYIALSYHSLHLFILVFPVYFFCDHSKICSQCLTSSWLASSHARCTLAW